MTVETGTTLTIDGTIFCYGEIIADGTIIYADGVNIYFDVNQDGEISMLDVQEILKIATGASETYKARADINGDGVVNSLDAYALYAECIA